MGNKTKDSKLKTNKAYLSKFKTVSVRIKPELYDKMISAADAGQSVNAWIIEAIKDKL